MQRIFSDCELLLLESAPQGQGIFVKAKKPVSFRENDPSSISLYSMVTNRRMGEIRDGDSRNWFYARQVLRQRLKRCTEWMGRVFWEMFRAVFKV